MRKAVFLDRDGTMVHDAVYLSRREDLKWFPWTVDALRLLNRAGFAIIVTTNQGGIGLGLFDEAFVRAIHQEMTDFLEAGGARVDGWFFCPHHPHAIIDELRIACDCRKPKTGMIDQAVAQFDLDVAESFVIGDRKADIELALAAGARGVLVRTGHGEVELTRGGGTVDGAAFVAEDLMEATSWILGQNGRPLA